MKDKKVVVIGSGIGGAGVAALLAKDGVRGAWQRGNPEVGRDAMDSIEMVAPGFKEHLIWY